MAKSACAGLLPITRGSVSLSEVEAGALTSVQPFKGKHAAVSAALDAGMGAKLPAPGRSTGKAGARVVWFGRESFVVIGAAVPAPVAADAAVSDQSDAWAVVRLEGAEVEAVLARLVPVDLRGKTFKRGHTCRTILGHVTVSITRVGAQAFEIMSFRSMAKTLVHDLETAMGQVAVRTGN
ncbi:sarcosine oxidase subunit gamma [Roseobacteraceae bacterium S113]